MMSKLQLSQNIISNSYVKTLKLMTQKRNDELIRVTLQCTQSLNSHVFFHELKAVTDVTAAVAEAETNVKRVTTALIIALSFTLRTFKNFIVRDSVIRDFIIRNFIAKDFIVKNFIVMKSLTIKFLIMKFMISSLTEILFKK